MQIDPGVVEKLLMVRLEAALTGSGVTLVARGRVAPVDGATAGDQAAVWTRIARITLPTIDRQKNSGEVDRSGLVCVLHVACGTGAMAASAYALGTAMQKVADAVARQRLTDSSPTHVVDLDQAETADDAEPFDSRLGATGSVTVMGFVERVS